MVRASPSIWLGTWLHTNHPRGRTIPRLLQAERSPPSPTRSRGLPVGTWGLLRIRHAASPLSIYNNQDEWFQGKISILALVASLPTFLPADCSVCILSRGWRFLRYVPFHQVGNFAAFWNSRSSCRISLLGTDRGWWLVRTSYELGSSRGCHNIFQAWYCRPV